MSFSVCPVAIIDAPVEIVWPLLSEPANYSLWWDAKTCSITPEGAAHAGQRIHATTYGLRVDIRVNRVDESERQIHLTTALPFGVKVENRITCTPVESGICRVSFG